MQDISDIFDLFARYGDEPYGEAVSQTQHALQTAQVAREAGEGEAMIGACLLHDIGQLLNDAGHAAARERRDARHELNGARYLEGRFPESVVAPIALHVAAKRWLARDPGYHAVLSDASKLSLALQGGVFSESEAEAFARLPFAAEALRLRGYDDGGKRAGLGMPALESYRPLIARLQV